MVRVRCLTCGKGFFVRPYRQKLAKFCSLTCRRPSEKTRKKMRLAKVGYIPWNKGKTSIYSKETLHKMSIWQKGKPSPSKGRIVSQETRKKIRDTLIKRNIGKPKHNGHIYQNNFWKELRKLIYKRDGWCCQECGCHFGQKHRPAAHHIDYDPTNNDPSNLISLCSSCHGKINYKKEEWINYYRDKVSKIVTL